jgi:hypothetical protein
LIHSALQIQLPAMLFDMDFNSLSTVLKNVYQSFRHAALRMYHYSRRLRMGAKSNEELIISECYFR